MARLRAGLRNENGNVAMTYALMAPVLLLASGAAIDYGRSASIKSQLNAAADAAALAALTPAMMQQSTSTAQAAAQSTFIALASGISGIPQPQPAPSVTVGADPTTGARNVTLTYSTSANTLFGAVTLRGAMPISGSSSASAQVPPNIDFYVLLDNSPSMLLPNSAAGITQMQNLTPDQDTNGCAFACHQTNTGPGAGNDTKDNLCLVTATATTTTKTVTTPKWGNSSTNTTTSPATVTTSYAQPGSNHYCTAPSTTNNSTTTTSTSGNNTITVTTTVTTSYTSTQLDNYAMARIATPPIILRMDDLTTGITNMLTTATTTTQSSQYSPPPQYRFAIYSMDSSWSIGLTQQVALTANYQSAWSTASATFGAMLMYDNNDNCSTAACTNKSSSGGDAATNYDNSLSKLSETSYIPAPGNGTNQAGDKPQEVLFIITDGLEDELYNNTGSRLYQAINDLGNTTYGRPDNATSGPFNLCTAIKNRGIKIAILYTDYYPVTSDSWYNTYVSAAQPELSQALLDCSSGPDYFIDLAIGGDTSAALTKLFNAVARTAHLTQ